MKVTSVRKNKITLDLSEDEYDLFLVDGLQKWIDKEIGNNKIKVIPVGKEYKHNKKINSIEMKDDFALECITLSVIEALKEMIKKHV